MILSKGCKILNLSNSTIVGSLSSNMKSQIRSLDLSQSAKPGRLPSQVYLKKTGTWTGEAYSTENIDFVEELLFSCCSLQCLKMEGLLITPKMAASICKNGKTLQILNLNNSYVIEFKVKNLVSGNLQAIIKCCQELKELAFTDKWVHDDDIEFLAKHVSINVVKLNLNNQDLDDNDVKILLSRCNKVKVLHINAALITNDSLKTMRQYLNLFRRIEFDLQSL